MTVALQANDSLLKRFWQGAVTGEAVITRLKQYGMMPQLLRELLIDQAIADICLSPEETLAACQQFYQHHELKSEADLQAWVTVRGLRREDLDRLISRNIRLAKFKQATWGNKLETYFLQRKPHFDQVVYSLLRVKDAAIAQELFFRIQEGEQTFAELARQYSQGPESDTGGMIGPMPLSTPHPILANLLTRSQPGQLLPPTRLNDWVVIVRLEQLLPAQLNNAMCQQLLNELFETWVKERLDPECLQSVNKP
jgi:parvulin-like peptidyl-prolyl isomerase